MNFCCILRYKKLLTCFFIIFFVITCESTKSQSFEKPLFNLKKEIKNEYLGLFFQNKKIGYFHGTANEASMGDKDVFYIYGNALIKLETEGQRFFTILSEEIILDAKNGRLIFFNYDQKIGDSSLNIKGVGKERESLLRISTGGRSEEIKIESDVIPLACAGFLVWKNGIQEGKTFKYKVYVEALQKIENLIIDVGKKKIVDGKNIYPLRQRLGNIEIITEVYENGETFREESIQGFTMKKIGKEEALRFEKESKTLSFYDLFAFSFIPVNKDLGDVKETLEIELRGVSDVKIPEGDFQKVSKKDDYYVIITSLTPINKTLNKNVEKFLQSSPKIQKEAQEIKDLAKNITYSAKNDREKIMNVVKWVNKNVKKKLRDKSSALEVLKDKEGECEAHSLLTAALLRSIGIPTKVVGGVVYSKEQKGFLYHAWNESFIDGMFIPLDATFGEFPANATHIKLTEEDNMEDVILFLGKAKLAVPK